MNTQSRRSKMDRLAAQFRLHDALKANGNRPLTVEQLRRIGQTPKGFRSSTGRKPWTQPPGWYRRAAA